MTFQRQHFLAAIVVASLLLFSTKISTGFVLLVATRKQPSIFHASPVTTFSSRNPTTQLFLYNQHKYYDNISINNSSNNNNNSDGGDDWKSIAREAGHVAKKVGNKMLQAIEAGGSKLVDAVSWGAQKTKEMLLVARGNNNNHNHNHSMNDKKYQSSDTAVQYDTYDEVLWQGVFDQSQYTTTTTTTTTTNTAKATPTNAARTNTKTTDIFLYDQFESSGTQDNSKVIEVEVLEGVCRPSYAPRHRIMDAEILEKIYCM